MLNESGVAPGRLAAGEPKAPTGTAEMLTGPIGPVQLLASGKPRFVPTPTGSDKRMVT